MKWCITAAFYFSTIYVLCVLHVSDLKAQRAKQGLTNRDTAGNTVNISIGEKSISARKDVPPFSKQHVETTSR